LLKKWTLKAGGHLKVDSMFLIKKVWKILRFIWREFGHAPKSVANVFVDVWNQTLVIRVVPCF